MFYVPDEVDVTDGRVFAFRHPLGEKPRDGQVWVLWAADGTMGATVRVPVARSVVRVVRHDGVVEVVHAEGHWITLDLAGGGDASATYLVLDMDW